VVAKRLIREGKAYRVMIIDLDHHEGNGTGECIIGENLIWSVSNFGAYMEGHTSTANNHVFQAQYREFEFREKRDIHYLAVIAEILPELTRRQNPDLTLYQAGMDPMIRFEWPMKFWQQ